MKFALHPLRRGALAALMLAALNACGDGKKADAAPAAPAQAEPAKANPVKADAVADQPVIATMGTITVPQAEITQWLRSLAPQQRAQVTADRRELDRVIRARLAEKALVAQAGTQGWADKEEIRRAVQAAQEQVVLRTYLDSVSVPPDSYPSEDELRAAYEAARDRLVQPAQYRISQIFVAAPFNDADKLAAARKQMNDISRRATAPKADFAELAREVSQDKASAMHGGDNGFATLAQLVPELRAVVQKLKPGEVSAPVQLAGGLHLLKLTEVRDAQLTPYDEVKPQLRAALRTARQEQAARAYLEGLVNAGTVSIDGKSVNAAIAAAE